MTDTAQPTEPDSDIAITEAAQPTEPDSDTATEAARIAPDFRLRAAASAAVEAIAILEAEIGRVHNKRGQAGTARLLGVAHTTYLRWMEGALRRKMEELEAHLNRVAADWNPIAKPRASTISPTDMATVRVERPVGRVTDLTTGEVTVRTERPVGRVTDLTDGKGDIRFE